jgi:hypothetical protein
MYMYICYLQDKEAQEGRDYSKQKLLLGTHTSEGEQNYLMVAEVCARALSQLPAIWLQEQRRIARVGCEEDSSMRAAFRMRFSIIMSRQRQSSPLATGSAKCDGREQQCPRMRFIPSKACALMTVQVQLPCEDSELDPRQYDEERAEVGGFGTSHGRVAVTQMINHDGEVNRARVMPQNKFLIATKTPHADVYVFDYSKHPSKPAGEVVRSP